MTDDQSVESQNSAWIAEQERLIDVVESTIDYYQNVTDRTRVTQRTFVIATMVLGIIAPILVAGARPDGAGLFGVPPVTINSIAIVITVLLSIMEGLRRIFRHEQRWISCHIALMALETALGRFRYLIVNVPPGADAWKLAMSDLRTEFENITVREREVFYSGMSSLAPKEDKVKEHQGI
ncbi:DUF4231 domain-containing protein [Rhizobium sp. PRIMUS64]|uniref:DUF4231 domain-containing protein n=1 Tax=Rhizobium sp. PRIMUS64 TaxID=2908925 RepID=UPI001FF1B664|nr:DUF4231 domain-containing protein [Rhizobium sp. PRIMUS64]MCJ9695144.1 DUF4231 domain-containing protein [Rhizobium sp. PRIMUS64]